MCAPSNDMKRPVAIARSSARLRRAWHAPPLAQIRRAMLPVVMTLGHPVLIVSAWTAALLLDPAWVGWWVPVLLLQASIYLLQRVRSDGSTTASSLERLTPAEVQQLVRLLPEPLRVIPWDRPIAEQWLRRQADRMAQFYVVRRVALGALPQQRGWIGVIDLANAAAAPPSWSATTPLISQWLVRNDGMRLVVALGSVRDSAPSVCVACDGRSSQSCNTSCATSDAQQRTGPDVPATLLSQLLLSPITPPLTSLPAGTASSSEAWANAAPSDGLHGGSLPCSDRGTLHAAPSEAPCEAPLALTARASDDGGEEPAASAQCSDAWRSAVPVSASEAWQTWRTWWTRTGVPDAVQTALMDLALPVGEADVAADAMLAPTIAAILSEFAVAAEVRVHAVGPTVVQYAVTPGQGVDVRRIMALEPTLAVRLGHAVRVAPLPDAAALGVEVVRAQRQIVSLGAVLQRLDPSALGDLDLVLGVLADGQPWVLDLARAPHVLIAGTTGSGKTTALHTALVSLLARHPPERLQVVLLDPKVVEFTRYDGLPHLAAPVASEPTAMVQTLQRVVDEMERRYRRLARAGDALTPLIVIIDEIGELFERAPAARTAVVRLAQLGRAARVHLLVGVQRPSVDVVAGVIKANFPVRIACAVPSAHDSQVILGQPGAERLAGRGDMLMMQSMAIRRAQGAWTDPSAVEALAAAWRCCAPSSATAMPLPWSQRPRTPAWPGGGHTGIALVLDADAAEGWQTALIRDQVQRQRMVTVIGAPPDVTAAWTDEGVRWVGARPADALPALYHALTDSAMAASVVVWDLALLHTSWAHAAVRMGKRRMTAWQALQTYLEHAITNESRTALWLWSSAVAPVLSLAPLVRQRAALMGPVALLAPLADDLGTPLPALHATEWAMYCNARWTPLGAMTAVRQAARPGMARKGE